MKFRNLPAIISLISGLVVCVVTFICKYEIQSTLLTLAVVMVIFYLVGLGLKLLLNKAFEQFGPKEGDEENPDSEGEDEEAATVDGDVQADKAEEDKQEEK